MRAAIETGAVTGRAQTYRGASPEAIRHHYDVGDDFYRLWLDPSLSYSCGLWEPAGSAAGAPHANPRFEAGEGGATCAATLAEAQRRKLDHLIAAGQAAGKDRVLDVGCGWGGLIRRLLGEHGVAHVVGLTLSEAQRDSIAAWAGKGCEVRLENWADHVPTAPYDAIVSVEAFEHFADFGMPRPERVAAYRRFYERCHEWLPPGGRLVVQTGVKGNNVHLDRQMVSDLLFVVRHVFPESELPWTSEILEASERRFEPVSVRNDPEDYVLTLRAWLSRLRASRARAEELLGEQAVADYERYLSAAVTAYERRHLGLLRVAFERT